ncbi:hypothetical protein MTR_2g026680 [Medicago truncatula]|uniref:Uncharacterized protein n=1 Tax=Medicago truncatula TaxID=3880 RepID=A0A072V4Q9_MEDTR|nr:hypothetical protein MTR_2g026680 [Medicago truncatula]
MEFKIRAQGFLVHHGRDKSDRKNIVVYVFIYGNETMSWCSNKKCVIALYSCEVEYIASSVVAYNG